MEHLRQGLAFVILLCGIFLSIVAVILGGSFISQGFHRHELLPVFGGGVFIFVTLIVWIIIFDDILFWLNWKREK